MTFVKYFVPIPTIIFPPFPCAHSHRPRPHDIFANIGTIRVCLYSVIIFVRIPVSIFGFSYYFPIFSILFLDEGTIIKTSVRSSSERYVH